MRWLLNLSLLASLVTGARAEAQFDAVSSIRVDGPVDSIGHATAGQAYADVLVERTMALNNVPRERGDMPRDSIARVVTARAELWMAPLSHGNVIGDGLDSYVQTALLAHDDARAQHLIETRLTSAGVSVADKTYTLLMAVCGFADPAIPARLPIAERYLERLKAFGPSGWGYTRQWRAELALFEAYDALGRSADAARHGIAAVRLLPHIPMADIAPPLDGEPNFYLRLASVLAVQSNGRATLDRLNPILLATAKPAADSVALDPMFGEQGAQLQGVWKSQIAKAQRIGETAAPIVSNYWINASDTAAHTLRLDDGKIRIVESGNRYCVACVHAMSGLERLQEAFPEIQAVLVTSASGMWANRTFATGAESVPYETDFFLHQLKLRYPIALWLFTKKRTEIDGSVVPDLSDDSTLVHYPEQDPLIYIIDGHGRIRYILSTYLPGDEFTIYANLIRHLEAEAGVVHGDSKVTSMDKGHGATL